MLTKYVVTGLAVLSLTAGCSKSRKQYEAPGDQRKDKKAESISDVLPAEPTDTAAGLVDGWYVEPTAEEEAATIFKAVREPIAPGKGLAGVDISMSRSEIETKLGQPDFVGELQVNTPVAVYGGGSFYIEYDRVTKSKVQRIIGLNGYLGQIQEMGFGIGTDLAPALAKFGGPEGLMKEVYKTFNPQVPDCQAKRLCDIYLDRTTRILFLTNLISIQYTDSPNNPEKKISAVLIFNRTPDAGLYYADAPILDLAQGTVTTALGSVTAGTSTLADTFATGDIRANVEARDFGRSLHSFGLNLSNDLSFAFTRSQPKNTTALMPLDTDKLVALSVNSSYIGTVAANGAPLLLEACKTTPGEGEGKFELSISTQTLNDKFAPSAAPVASGSVVWAIRVSSVKSASAGCVSTKLQPSLALSIKNLLKTIGEESTAAFNSFNAPYVLVNIFGKDSDTGNLKLTYVMVSDDKTQNEIIDNPQAPALTEPTLALGRKIFEASYKQILQAVQASSASKIVESTPLGYKSLADRASYERTLTLYADETMSAGLAVSVGFSEASRALGFSVEVIKPEFRNVNSALSLVVQKDGNSTVDLEAPGVLTGLFDLNVHEALATETLRMNPFDRSLRYAELLASEQDPRVAAYAEKVSMAVTNGSSIVNRVYDIAVALNGVEILGKRVRGSSETQSDFLVESVGMSGFPKDTGLNLTCASQAVSIKIGAEFQDVSKGLATCPTSLTPGYAAGRIPSEIHIVPEGDRRHGITLIFADQILSGFYIYSVK